MWNQSRRCLGFLRSRPLVASILASLLPMLAPSDAVAAEAFKKVDVMIVRHGVQPVWGTQSCEAYDICSFDLGDMHVSLYLEGENWHLRVFGSENLDCCLFSNRNDVVDHYAAGGAYREDLYRYVSNRDGQTLDRYLGQIFVQVQ